MVDMHLEIVRFVLALHLGVDPLEVAPGDRLEADLGLDPLDLVLVALRLEEIEDCEFPVAELEMVVTVAELVGVVRAWAVARVAPSSSPSSDERETLIPPEVAVRTRSGVLRKVAAATGAQAVIPLPLARAARA